MEQIGDMLILEKTEYKYNHQYYKVRCIICGHEREVSLHNLKIKGANIVVEAVRMIFINMSL